MGRIYIYIYKYIWHTHTHTYIYIFIIKVFRTIVFIFIVISTTFRPICPPAFFRCLSNSGTFMELRTTSFIETTGSPVLILLAMTRVRQTPEEGRRTYRLKRCGNNNKDEDNSPKNLNDKNQQASSQKFRQLIYLYVYILYVLTKSLLSELCLGGRNTAYHALWKEINVILDAGWQ